MEKRYEIYLIILSVGLTLLAHFKIYYSSMLNWHLPPAQIFIRNISIMVLFLIIYVVLKIMKFKGNLVPFIAMSFLTGISLSLNYRLGIASVYVRLFNTYVLSIMAGILLLPAILYYFRNNLVTNFKKRYYFLFGITLIFTFVYFIPFLSRLLPEYAVERFMIWSDFWAGFPSAEWFNRIYQPLNSMFAVHSGGIFGTGLGMGYPYLIPKSSSDFIYSALAEEVGFAGSFSVIIIYFSLVVSGLINSFKCRDTFVSYSVLGFSIIIGIQVFVNIAGVLNLIPLTGIPLPFLSKGGFAFITFSFMVGFVMSASETEFFSGDEPQHHKEV